ncbi:MAG: hypothetical protein FWG71_09835 [Synergistaceae bacterium]|nr:hypothetical protein [Synergistaceae bacterium]
MSNQASPYLLVAVVNRVKNKRLEEIFREKHVPFQYLLNAVGTARSEVLKVLGLSGSEKTIGLCVTQRYKARQVMTSVLERMEMTRPGQGIVFTVPLSGVSKSIARVFEAENEEYAEGRESHMERTETQSELKRELVLVIVDNGYSEEVMTAARTAGARGGTVLHARQTALDETAKFFGISLQSDKEMVLIVIEEAQKVELMQSIVTACGIRTDARGLVISLPIESCAGLTPI